MKRKSSRLSRTSTLLTERLNNLSDALIKKYEAREEFDRTISETEQAFMRILESSQTLLHVLKKEDS